MIIAVGLLGILELSVKLASNAYNELTNIWAICHDPMHLFVFLTVQGYTLKFYVFFYKHCGIDHKMVLII